MLRTLLTLSVLSVATAAAAQDDFKTADSQLNAVYKQIQGRLKGDPSTARLLLAAQRSWISFRDAECAFAASATVSGTAYPEVVGSCKASLTEKRTDELKAFLQCEEGDLACPVPTP